MRKMWLLLALTLCGCSTTQRRVEQHVRYERRDSLRALFCEELTVRLDDVRIIPPDSVHPRLEARSATVEMRRKAVVEAVATDSARIERSDISEPASAAKGRWRPPLWSLLLTSVVFYVLGMCRRRG